MITIKELAVINISDKCTDNLNVSWVVNAQGLHNTCILFLGVLFSFSFF